MPSLGPGDLERRVVLEHALLELRSAGEGSIPSSVENMLPELPVAGQRLSLPSGAVAAPA